jgi:hypothetical protein
MVPGQLLAIGEGGLQLQVKVVAVYPAHASPQRLPDRLPIPDIIDTPTPSRGVGRRVPAGAGAMCPSRRYRPSQQAQELGAFS